MPKLTKESILASGHLTIIRPPEAITRAPHAPWPAIGITRSQLYSDLPAPWLRSVKTPGEMNDKERNRELGKQLTRLGHAHYGYGNYRGPAAAEDYIGDRRRALGLTNDLTDSYEAAAGTDEYGTTPEAALALLRGTSRWPMVA